MLLRKQILTNAGSNWASMIVTMVAGLILVPIMLNYLGEEGYGVWALLARGLSYVIILEGAFVLAINRFVAYYRDDSGKMNSFVSVSFILLFAAGILTVIVATVISFFVADIFKAIPQEMAFQAQITCILVGITFALKMLEANFSGALRGFQYYVRSNMVLITFNLLRLFLSVVFLFIWKSIIALQSAFVISAAISLLLMIIVTKGSIPNFSVGLRHWTKDARRELLRYMSHSFARSGSSIIMYNTMTLLVGWKGTARDVTVYDIAFRIPGFVRGFLASTQNVFLPTITTLCARKEFDKIKAVVNKGTQMLTTLTCSILILIFVFTPELLAFWLHGNVLPGMITVMRLIIISVIPGGLFEIWLPVLVGVGHLKGLTVASVMMVVGSIILGITLLGSDIAVPIVPAISLVVVLWLRAGIWLPLYGIHKLEIPLYEYFRQGIARPLLASIISIAVVWGFYRFPSMNSVNWMIRGTILTIIVMSIFVVIVLPKEVGNFITATKKRFRAKGNLI